jgi:hypothetical protein
MIRWVPRISAIRSAEGLDRVISAGHSEGGGECLGVVAADYQFVVVCPFQADQDTAGASVVDDDECFLTLMPDGPDNEDSGNSGTGADAVHRAQSIIQHLDPPHGCDRHPDIASMNGFQLLHLAKGEDQLVTLHRQLSHFNLLLRSHSGKLVIDLLDIYAICQVTVYVCLTHFPPP